MVHKQLPFSRPLGQHGVFLQRPPTLAAQVPQAQEALPTPQQHTARLGCSSRTCSPHTAGQGVWAKGQLPQGACDGCSCQESPRAPPPHAQPARCSVSCPGGGGGRILLGAGVGYGRGRLGAGVCGGLLAPGAGGGRRCRGVCGRGGCVPRQEGPVSREGQERNTLRHPPRQVHQDACAGAAGYMRDEERGGGHGSGTALRAPLPGLAGQRRPICHHGRGQHLVCGGRSHGCHVLGHVGVGSGALCAAAPP